MSQEVSATIALAYLDSRIRERREDAYRRMQAAKRCQQHTLETHLYGQIAVYDQVRQYIAHLLGWVEAVNPKDMRTNGG